MDRGMDALDMLDLMVRPGFCVRNQIVERCNAAAESLLFQPGMTVSSILATGREEYAEFTGGCLYLTVIAQGSPWGASVTRMGDRDIFILEQEADQAELRSMALAARELRTPLSNVMTTAERLFPMEALLEDPQLREYAARLNRGLHQMLRIIGNMSDAEQYSSCTTDVLETRDIGDFLGEIFSRAENLVSHTGLTLHFENLEQRIFCLIQPEKLERAVMNILSNAMKFTPPGGRIEAKLQRRAGKLYLSVANTGEGIPESIRGSVHSRYLRRPGIEDGRFGIGLGMVLIRSAAASHGGTVLIDQPENYGTRITMTIAIRQNTSGNVHSPLLRIDYAGERDHGLIELSDILPADLYDI